MNLAGSQPLSGQALGRSVQLRLQGPVKSITVCRDCLYQPPPRKGLQTSQNFSGRYSWTDKEFYVGLIDTDDLDLVNYGFYHLIQRWCIFWRYLFFHGNLELVFGFVQYDLSLAYSNIHHDNHTTRPVRGQQL